MSTQITTDLLPNILSNLPIADIIKTCSSLTPNRYQRVCKNNQLWRFLLYRDYDLFSPIIVELETESYFDLYKEFYHNIFFNSDDFRKLYRILLKSSHSITFINQNGEESIIPTLVDVSEFEDLNAFEAFLFKTKRYDIRKSVSTRFSSPVTSLRLIFPVSSDLREEIENEFNIAYISSGRTQINICSIFTIIEPNTNTVKFLS